MANVGGIDLTGATIAAFGTLLVYDYAFVTFDREVQLVWPARWTAGKVLFLLNRYLPFIDTFLSLHLLTGSNTDSECLFGFKAVTWLIVVGIIIAETILMMRTYALWGGNRKILVSLAILWLAVSIPAAIITQLEVDSFAYAATDSGCSKTRPSSPIIFVAFLLLIMSETVIVALTVIRAYRHREHRRSILLVRMYQDGLLYYLYLFAFSLVNLLIAVAAPPNFANWLTTPQRVLHSILCTRVLLHIREGTQRSETFVPSVSAGLSFERRKSQGGNGFGSKDSGDTSLSEGGTGSGTSSGGEVRTRLSHVEETMDGNVKEEGSSRQARNSKTIGDAIRSVAGSRTSHSSRFAFTSPTASSSASGSTSASSAPASGSRSREMHRHTSSLQGSGEAIKEAEEGEGIEMSTGRRGEECPPHERASGSADKQEEGAPLGVDAQLSDGGIDDFRNGSTC